MKSNITNLIHINEIYVYNIDLVEHLEKVWLDKNFPDRPFNSHIDIYNPNGNNNYVMRCKNHVIPFVIGEYDECVVELSEQQTKEYKTFRDLHDIFYQK